MRNRGLGTLRNDGNGVLDLEDGVTNTRQAQYPSAKRERMALHGCRECGKPVGAGSDACPHCGATAPWSRKNPRRGNDALWVMGTLIIGTILLLAFGCSATEPDQDTHIPQLGRYDYRLTHNRQQFSADLVIESASATQVRYRIFFDFSSNQAQTTQPTGTSWPILVFDLGARSATNTMSRHGESYGCTAPVRLQATFSPGTCSFTFAGPDSVRTSP